MIIYFFLSCGHHKFLETSTLSFIGFCFVFIFVSPRFPLFDLISLCV